MHDLVIRGATLVDGTGRPRRIADVAVEGARICAVGVGVPAGKREIKADGLLLTPGWVDIHTHYDGQATWDPYLTPSSWHGVTTAVFGNCGVGFAPVRPGSERYLIQLMEGVEDIPETVLAEGIDFRWESFPQYLDVLEAMPRIMDIGAQLPHAALRFYVMGDRGADHASLPNASEIERMSELVEKALCAGALGFSTSRTIKHKTKDGRFTPSLSAREPELAGIAHAMRRAGSGVLEVNSDFDEGDFEILRGIAQMAGRPLSVLLLQVNNAPDLWRDTLERIHAVRRDGQEVTGQVGSRPIGVNMALEGTIHPFITHPLWRQLEALEPAERVRKLQSDAELRHRLWREVPDDATTRWIADLLPRTYKLSEPIDYEPNMNDSLAAQAKRLHRDPWDLALEWLLERDGKQILFITFENYSEGDLRVVGTLLEDEATVCGLADAGAHVGFLCDASSPTTMLKEWTRGDRRGYHALPLEFLVKKQTADTARAYGLHDRGLIAPGYRADFNLIDFDALGVTMPEIVYDLPAGGRRLIQRAKGYRHTFVAGVEVMRDGMATGAFPGRLIRGGRSAPL
ncbi:MAG TPA: amidohydrolase family protein [Burkholderiales bacterium]|nr:amidohydrolase family protein [Burkholderiales bacterium]